MGSASNPGWHGGHGVDEGALELSEALEVGINGDNGRNNGLRHGLFNGVLRGDVGARTHGGDGGGGGDGVGACSVVDEIKQTLLGSSASKEIALKVCLLIYGWLLSLDSAARESICCNISGVGMLIDRL